MEQEKLYLAERKAINTTLNAQQAAEFELYFGRRRWSVALEIGVSEMLARRKGIGLQDKIQEKSMKLARALERLSANGIDISDFLPKIQGVENTVEARE